MVAVYLKQKLNHHNSKSYHLPEGLGRQKIRIMLYAWDEIAAVTIHQFTCVFRYPGSELVMIHNALISSLNRV